ncbi:CRISPR-associated endonuclease Cas2 [Lepagella muris]|uniref:CRISPR-associated endonuclease Cas2 n=2 Tax=Muribaculaceae TaxID=2005473 RepID=A0AC61RGF8_9BACT|nr:CRISPR-associated endonuclease Cas2 [Lepagella muris]ROT09191.1 CRISPR-associated endonuclease Cas2 [Muribaculaceae bacterium Isolate-037 (Harlan)]TGY76659.1 CRISPR-associated endonuclease Cas2 [Lepagella muris]THG48209.1 CRISPR-associated endonuclease Cas2 [Bacteroidales bacterium]TKC54369.1 CRISPR-associated endonuclease Cas2 [Bacteroidales bacterium]
MQTTRLNQYKIMWVIVFFDLPVETKKQRKDYSDFRKRLLSDGFTMFQLSIYVRPCASQENSQVHINRVKSFLPEAGKICIMSITDRQFGDIIVFEGATKTPPKTNAIQLELF